MQNDVATYIEATKQNLPRVAELNIGEQILIWSLRHAHHYGVLSIRPGLVEVFGESHIDHAMEIFTSITDIIQSTDASSANVHVPWSPEISRAELETLHAVALAQHHVDINLALRQSSVLSRYDSAALAFHFDQLAHLFRAIDKPLRLQCEPTEEIASRRQDEIPAVLQLSEQQPEETVLLVGVRVWVSAVKNRQPSTPPIADYLLSLNLGAFVQPICAIMRNTASNATRLLEVHCPHCNSLSIDEARLLHAIACAQRGQRFQSEQVIASWLQAPHRHKLAMDLQELAQRMLRADQRLPLRAWQFPETHGGVSSWQMAHAAARRTLH